MTVDSETFVPKRYNGTRPQAIDDFISAVGASIRKRPPTTDEFILPLSGGRDSRHILFELVKQGHRPKTCVTLGFTGGKTQTDESVARLVTEALSIPHSLLERRPSRPSLVEFDKNVVTHMCADEHEWFTPLALYLADNAQCTYSGVGGTWEPDGGTVLTVQMAKLLASGALPQVADLLLGNFGTDEARLATLLTREQAQLMPVDTARERVLRELERHAHAPNPLGSFWFWNRERREHALAAHGMLGSVPVVHLPFLDSEVVRLMASLPTEFLADRSFHTDAVLRAFPKLAHLPFSVTPTSLVARDGARDRMKATSDLTHFALRNNRHRLPSVLRLGLGRVLGMRPMSLRMTAYLMQLEAISSGRSTGVGSIAGAGALR